MNNLEPIIKVRDMEARYGDTTVLHDIDFDIYPNQITAILGTSGCGKTTMLKNILRLEEPYKGSVKYWGEEVVGMDELHFEAILKKVGVLFQNGALINSLSVFENIAIPLEQHTKLSKRLIRRIIRVKLDLVRMGGTGALMPAELSGGMRKRAALARAMALDPQILFCDEPTAGLDPLTASALDILLRDLKNQLKMSIVIITHDLATIHRIADRIIFMEDGSLIFQGTLSEAMKAQIPSVDTFFNSAVYA